MTGTPISYPDPCPSCGKSLDFDEVDVGVCVIRHCIGCPHCHWTPEELPPLVDTVDTPGADTDGGAK